MDSLSVRTFRRSRSILFSHVIFYVRSILVICFGVGLLLFHSPKRGWVERRHTDTPAPRWVAQYRSRTLFPRSSVETTSSKSIGLTNGHFYLLRPVLWRPGVTYGTTSGSSSSSSSSRWSRSADGRHSQRLGDYMPSQKRSNDRNSMKTRRSNSSLPSPRGTSPNVQLAARGRRGRGRGRSDAFGRSQPTRGANIYPMPQKQVDIEGQRQQQRRTSNRNNNNNNNNNNIKRNQRLYRKGQASPPPLFSAEDNERFRRLVDILYIPEGVTRSVAGPNTTEALKRLLFEWAEGSEELSFATLATILNRASRLRMQLPKEGIECEYLRQEFRAMRLRPKLAEEDEGGEGDMKATTCAETSGTGVSSTIKKNSSISRSGFNSNSGRSSSSSSSSSSSRSSRGSNGNNNNSRGRGSASHIGSGTVSSGVISGALLGLSSISGWKASAAEDVMYGLRKAVENSPPDTWRTRDITKAFKGLGYLEDSGEVRRIVVELARRIEGSPEFLDGFGIATIMHGIRNLRDCAEVRYLFRALSSCILQSSKQSLSTARSSGKTKNQLQLSAVGIGHFYYGLQRIGESSPELEELLRVAEEVLLDDTSPRSGSRTEYLTSQEVGCAFYGLQSLPGDSPGVIRAADLLVDKVLWDTEPLTEQAISNTLYGLQNVIRFLPNSSLLRLLRSITCAVQAFPSPSFSAQSFSNCLYGLRNIIVSPPPSSEIGRAHELLLLSLAEKAPTSIDNQGVGVALYSLHGIPESLGTRAILRSLAPLIGQVRGRATSRMIANALYGLRNTNHCPEAAAILRELRLVATRSQAVSSSSSSSSAMRFSPQELSNSLYGMRYLVDTLEGGEMTRVLSNLVVSEGLEPPSATFSPQELSNAIYGLALAGDPRYGRDPVELESLQTALEELLGFLAAHLERQWQEAIGRDVERGDGAGGGTASSLMMSLQEVSAALFGLHSHGDSAGARRLLHLLEGHLRQLLRHDGGEGGEGGTEGVVPAVEIDPWAIGNIIFGLRAIHHCPELDSMLSVVAEAVQRCHWKEFRRGATDDIDDDDDDDGGGDDAQAISNAIFGLQGLPLSPPVRAIVDAIAPRIELAAAPFSSASPPSSSSYFHSQHLGNMLYGLQAMEDDATITSSSSSSSQTGSEGDSKRSIDPSLKRLLDAITQHLPSPEAAEKSGFGILNLSQALYGVMHMKSRHPIYTKLLEHVHYLGDENELNATLESLKTNNNLAFRGSRIRGSSSRRRQQGNNSNGGYDVPRSMNKEHEEKETSQNEWLDEKLMLELPESLEDELRGIESLVQVLWLLGEPIPAYVSRIYNLRLELMSGVTRNSLEARIQDHLLRRQQERAEAATGNGRGGGLGDTESSPVIFNLSSSGGGSSSSFSIVPSIHEQEGRNSNGDRHLALPRPPASFSSSSSSSFQFNTYVDGFEMDIYDPATRTNVELDGYVSKRRKDLRRDRIRDQYLRDRHGIETVRVKVYAGLRYEDAAREVETILDTRESQHYKNSWQKEQQEQRPWRQELHPAKDGGGQEQESPWVLASDE